MDTEKKFEAVDSDYNNFKLVEKKRSTRPDLHAFLMLDELFPNKGVDILSAAGHDKIWIDVDSGDIDRLTDEQILELVRCGIIYDSESDSLAMFV